MAATTATVTTADNPAFPGWRRNLAFIWIGVFVALLGAQFVFPFIPFFIRDLGVTDKSQVAYYSGLAGSVTGLSLTLTAPIWGSLADRFGRRPMFLRALIGAGLLVMMIAFIDSVWQLLLLRFLMGAFAGTMGAAAALVAATTPREKVGYAMGTLQTGVFMANMVGPIAGGLMAASLGIRESFLFCGALYLLAALLVFLFVHEPRIVLNPVGGRAKSGGLIQNLKIVVSERQIVLMLGFLFVLWLSTTFIRPVLPISIDDFSEQVQSEDSNPRDNTVLLTLPGRAFHPREEAATGLVFGIVGLTSTIAALAVSRLGQRLGYRNCVTFAAVMTGVFYIPLAFTGTFTTFFLFFGAVGLFQGAMVPGTNALIAASVPEGKQGSAFGLAASMQSLALLIGPIGGGFASGLFGIESVYVIIGVILLFAAVAARLLIREPEALTG